MSTVMLFTGTSSTEPSAGIAVIRQIESYLAGPAGGQVLLLQLSLRDYRGYPLPVPSETEGRNGGDAYEICTYDAI